MNETKMHILKTSLVLFLQKTYRDVTMREIVEKTGLSKGAFYHYFVSKEELFKEIVTMFMKSGGVNYPELDQTSLQKFYLSYIASVDKSLMSLGALVDEKDRSAFNFNFFQILFEAVSRFPEFLQMELEQHHKDLQAWTEIIKQARKNREIKTRVSDVELARLFLYCSDGVFLRFINNDNPSSFKEYLTKAFTSIYDSIKS